MARFSPDSSVLATVTMTRTAYAQLMGQKFHPPKVFGQWMEKDGSSEWRWRDIGTKIVSVSVFLSFNVVIFTSSLGLRFRDDVSGS